MYDNREAIAIAAIAVASIAVGVVTFGAGGIAMAALGGALIGGGIGLGFKEAADLADNGKIDATAGAYLGAYAVGAIAGGSIAAGGAIIAESAASGLALSGVSAASKLIGGTLIGGGMATGFNAAIDVQNNGQFDSSGGEYASAYLEGAAFSAAAEAVPSLLSAAKSAVSKIGQIGKAGANSAPEQLKMNLQLFANKGDLSTSDDVYSGVRDASKYLKSQNVPRPYRKQILESFDVRTIKMETAGENIFGIRFYDGVNAEAKGRYLFDTFSPLTNRGNLSLPYEWNQMTGIQQFQISASTPMITGNAAAQTMYGSQYVGGAKQIYINNLEDLI